jgi:YHS domain-containing protein
MKVAKWCDACNQSVIATFNCDTCGEDLRVKYYGVPITVEFSYGHPLDGSEYHFCNYSCLLKFIVSELGKQSVQEKEKDK